MTGGQELKQVTISFDWMQSQGDNSPLLHTQNSFQSISLDFHTLKLINEDQELGNFFWLLERYRSNFFKDMKNSF